MYTVGDIITNGDGVSYEVVSIENLDPIEGGPPVLVVRLVKISDEQATIIASFS